MIEVAVSCDGAKIYQAKHASYISEHHFLLVRRPDPHQPRVQSNRGPHFCLGNLPTPLLGLNEESTWFECNGKGTLGSVSFVGGAAARDGTESWEIAWLSAEYSSSERGIAMVLACRLGEPIRRSFCYDPRPKLDESRYDIEVRVSFSSLGTLLRIHETNERLLEIVKNSVAKRYGATVADQVKPQRFSSPGQELSDA